MRGGDGDGGGGGEAERGGAAVEVRGGAAVQLSIPGESKSAQSACHEGGNQHAMREAVCIS